MAMAHAIGAPNNWRGMSIEPLGDTGMIKGLSRETSEALKKASILSNYSANELVFSEGDPAIGAYIVRRGKIKLVANSSDGKRLLLRIALPGQIIGLSAALSERNNDSSAEVVETTAVSFIKTESLYQLMEKYGDLSLRLAQKLSLECSSLCQELSALGLQRSAMSRLARLLVGLSQSVAFQRGRLQINCSFTHEEMAQMIGTSRETVSRLLHDLRDQGVASLKNDILTIDNLPDLQRLSRNPRHVGNQTRATERKKTPRQVLVSCPGNTRT